ncbi:MAG: hypothetical protein HQ523_09715 [Lentisphaerae bacterium]|nr:hypothetical protein [Lentisphaerota bacterium]
MPEYLKCGADNQQGRVFCFRRGGRLDFSESTARHFRARFKGEREMRVLRRLKELEVTQQAVGLVVGAP